MLPADLDAGGGGAQLKTLFLMGAGASKAMFNLPVMANFFETFDQSKYPALTAFITAYYLSDWVRQRQISLEDMVTALELRNDQFGSFGQQSEVSLGPTRIELDRLLYERLSLTSGTDKALAILEQIGLDVDDFANNEQTETSVLSLNYDVGIDSILRRASLDPNRQEVRPGTILSRLHSLLGQTRIISGGDRPSVFWQYKNKGVYIKLHGSLDWLYCSNANCYNHQLFFPNMFSDPKVNDRYGDPCGLCGTPLTSVIVPPTLRKSFEEFPKLRLLWNLAFKQLLYAERIVIFGVSFAPSDYYLQWLIRSAMASSILGPKKSLEIVNINNDTCSIVERLSGRAPVFRDDLVDKLA